MSRAGRVLSARLTRSTGHSHRRRILVPVAPVPSADASGDDSRSRVALRTHRRTGHAAQHRSAARRASAHRQGDPE